MQSSFFQLALAWQFWEIQPPEYAHPPLGFGTGKVPQHCVMAVAQFSRNRTRAHAVRMQHLESAARCVHLPGSALAALNVFRCSMAGAVSSLIFRVHLPVMPRSAALATLLIGAGGNVLTATLDARPLRLAPHRLPWLHTTDCQQPKGRSAPLQSSLRCVTRAPSNSLPVRFARGKSDSQTR